MLHTQALLSNACVVGAQQCKPSWWVTSVACFTYLYIPATHTHPTPQFKHNNLVVSAPTGVSGAGVTPYAVTPAQLGTGNASSVDVLLAPAETLWTTAEKAAVLAFTASGKGVVIAGAPPAAAPAARAQACISGARLCCLRASVRAAPMPASGGRYFWQSRLHATQPE